jgi:4-hydroxyacetophenone monooxygenase
VPDAPEDPAVAEARAALPVVVVGCGQSGLLAGIRLQEAGIPFTIVEKNPGPGGTWFDNRSPGARVDIGSHFYCYSFEPADHWSEYFCRQPELKAYFERVMHKYGLEANTRFRTEVLAASWDEGTGRWAVELRNPDGSTETLDAFAVISGVGALNQPKMPDIPGLEDFAGPLFHSARWPEGLDITGKRFALIGAGASGFQIAPTIAEQVEHLDIYQRTAQWVMPNPNYHRQVPSGEVWAMQHLPFYARWFRFLMFWPGAGLSIEGSRVDPDHDDSDGLAISATSRERRGMFEKFITDGLEGRPDLIEKVMPHYPVSAKRMLQDNGVWLDCLKRDDVELIRTGIERIVPEGVVTTDGVLHPADVICCATGFRHNDFLWPIEFRGRGGVRLRDQFGDEPKAYLGITIPNFPNLFCLYGPGTNLAHGASLIFQSESQVAYVMSALRHLLTTGARGLEPRKDVHDEYADRYQSEISQMVWAHWSVKHSHFKNAKGEIWTISPWPIPDYWRWCHDFRADDYVLV